MLRKFVYITGALDFLVGAGTYAGAILQPQKDVFVGLMTLGTFLMMAAACLMWASKDIANRAPVIFWQGLVRLTAVSSMLYAIQVGLADSWGYALVPFDGIIGIVYIAGTMKVTGLSFFGVLLCKDPKSLPSTEAISRAEEGWVSVWTADYTDEMDLDGYSDAEWAEDHGVVPFFEGEYAVHEAPKPIDELLSSFFLSKLWAVRAVEACRGAEVSESPCAVVRVHYRHQPRTPGKGPLRFIGCVPLQSE